MNERILIIDDEPSTHEVVRAYLEREGFIVYSATSGDEGLELAMSKRPQLVVLDLMLPDISGEEICRQLRERSDVAILMLTAKSTEDQRVEGLQLGADDYVVKPFSPRELVARVKAVLRRTGKGEMPLVELLRFDSGRLEIDSVRHEVRVAGTPADLTPSEYKLLLALAQYPGRAYSRFELINRVQGYDFEGYERTVDAHVKNLRHKIEPDPGKPRYVETVHGVGYRLGLEQLHHAAFAAGVRRRFAPHQLRHAHAVEMSREGISLIVIQRQLGHADLAITSRYLRGIDNTEIIQAVHQRPEPMIPAGRQLLSER